MNIETIIVYCSYHMKNYGDLGGCYPPPLDLQNSSLQCGTTDLQD